MCQYIFLILNLFYAFFSPSLAPKLLSYRSYFFLWAGHEQLDSAFIGLKINCVGRPSALTECQVTNKTLSSMKIECQEGKYFISDNQINSSITDGNVQLNSDVTSVNFVFVSDNIINNSNNYRRKCVSYSKTSEILCVLYFLFLHFLYNLGKHVKTNLRKFRFPCYIWHICIYWLVHFSVATYCTW